MCMLGICLKLTLSQHQPHAMEIKQLLKSANKQNNNTPVLMHLAQLKRAVNDRIEHGVGQTHEREEHQDFRIELGNPHESVEHGVDDVVGRPAQDKGNHDDDGHSERLALSAAQEVTSHQAFTACCASSGGTRGVVGHRVRA